MEKVTKNGRQGDIYFRKEKVTKEFKRISRKHQVNKIKRNYGDVFKKLSRE